MKKPKTNYLHTTQQIAQMRPGARLIGAAQKTFREKWSKVERQLEEVEDIKRNMAQFSATYTPLGWALYDRMSTPILEKLKTLSVSDGEALLIEYHLSEPSCSQLRYRFMTPPFSPWLHIYETALNRCEAKDWISAAPLLLICIDGLLTTTTGKHPFSGGADAQVFDTVTSEPGGLSEGLRVLGATRRKLSMEPIDAPFRHGIVHGLNPQYGSAIVVAKAINLLQATVDYVQNLRDEALRIERAHKEQTSPTWSELSAQWNRNAEVRAALDSWSSRDERTGVVATHLDCASLDAGSPEKAASEYLALLVNRNFGAMAQATVDYTQKPIGQRAGLIRQDLQGLTLTAWEISSVEDFTPAMTRMEANLTFTFKGESRSTKSQLRMLYTDENHEAMARGLPDGTWRAMANLVTDLWVQTKAKND